MVVVVGVGPMSARANVETLLSSGTSAHNTQTDGRRAAAGADGPAARAAPRGPTRARRSLVGGLGGAAVGARRGAGRLRVAHARFRGRVETTRGPAPGCQSHSLASSGVWPRLCALASLPAPRIARPWTVPRIVIPADALALRPRPRRQARPRPLVPRLHPPPVARLEHLTLSQKQLKLSQKERQKELKLSQSLSQKRAQALPRPLPAPPTLAGSDHHTAIDPNGAIGLWVYTTIS